LTKKKKKKKQNSETLNPQPIKSFSTPHYLRKQEGSSTPDASSSTTDAGSNLPRRRRQTELDAKGVTPELLTLKFYCS
jgi:hypothetical protein